MGNKHGLSNYECALGNLKFPNLLTNCIKWDHTISSIIYSSSTVDNVDSRTTDETINFHIRKKHCGSHVFFFFCVQLGKNRMEGEQILGERYSNCLVNYPFNLVISVFMCFDCIVYKMKRIPHLSFANFES